MCVKVKTANDRPSRLQDATCTSTNLRPTFKTMLVYSSTHAALIFPMVVLLTVFESKPATLRKLSANARPEECGAARNTRSIHSFDTRPDVFMDLFFLSSPSNCLTLRCKRQTRCRYLIIAKDSPFQFFHLNFGSSWETACRSSRMAAAVCGCSLGTILDSALAMRVAKVLRKTIGKRVPRSKGCVVPGSGSDPSGCVDPRRP